MKENILFVLYKPRYCICTKLRGPHIKEYELGMKDKCLIYFVCNLRKQENSVVAQRVEVSGFHPLLFALANLNNLHKDVRSGTEKP